MLMSMDVMAVRDWTYVKDLPKDIGPARHLLESYSKIPYHDLDDHIRRVREKAWDVSRYPCVGRWKFLYILDPQDPRYQQVLFRLNVGGSRDVLLDLGCGVGQVIRQLRSDGVDGSQLIGTDLQSKFIEIGYDLFQDRDSLGATFVTGDMLDPDDKRLTSLRGKVTIIHAGSFFHLFNWVQQLYVGKRLVEFLKPGTRNALIYGRHVGTNRPGESRTSYRSAYLHDQASFQRLWDEVGTMTRTQWKVQVEPTGEPVAKLPGFSSDAYPVNFTIYQIS
ncbi:Fc.00g038420.m01.CDS01 [Cosmosporella sp. VM-42]